MKILKKHRRVLLLSAAILVYGGVFSWMSINRLHTMRSYYYDLGIMHQVVHNTSQGRWLEMTDPTTLTNVSRFAIHFDPILAAAAPFYHIHDGPETLLVLQAFAVAFGAIPVWFISKRLIRSVRWAAAMMIAYLLYFPLQAAVMFDVHGVVFAVPALLYCVWFFIEKKPILGWLFLLIAFTTKEHIPLVTAVAGGSWAVLQWKNTFARYQGIVITVVSSVVFGIVMGYVIPAARDTNHFALEYYAHLGSNYAEKATFFIRKPEIITDYLLTFDSLWYGVQLLLPYGFVSLAAPYALLPAAPELAINLLSSNENMQQLFFHYTVLIATAVILSAIAGIAAIKKRYGRVPRLIIVIMVAGMIWNVYYWSPLPVPGMYRPFEVQPVAHEKLETIRFWQRILKNDMIPVSTTPKIAPYFSGRKYFYDFLFDPAFYSLQKQETITKLQQTYTNAQYVIIAETEIPFNRSFEERFYRDLIANETYQLIFDRNGIEVYQRIAETPDSI